MEQIEILKEFWLFLKQRKKLWLMPMVITLLLLAIILVLTAGSSLAPFIYSLF